MEETEGVMDVDQCLVGKFSSMGTTDKDVLIDEFRKLLGFQLNAAGCEFFLDMTNWNLHAAIGAYYDFEMPSSKIPSMSFVSDITIGEGEAIPPGTDFIKTWRFQNSGVEKWPLGCTLRFVNGERMSSPEWISVGEVQPHETVDVSVKMRSPINAGLYQGQWRMFTRGMAPFGDIIWVIISVEVGGLLGVTQQMSQFSTGTNNQHQLNTTQNNPFAVDGLGANMDVNVSFGSNNGGQTFDEV
uniref:Nbr1 FW domain-containing protein n=2 Tax=Ciona intestinalis TaxID=7719 RepID=H2XV90_CIOIN